MEWKKVEDQIVKEFCNKRFLSQCFSKWLLDVGTITSQLIKSHLKILTSEYYCFGISVPQDKPSKRRFSFAGTTALVAKKSFSGMFMLSNKNARFPMDYMVPHLKMIICHIFSKKDTLLKLVSPELKTYHLEKRIRFNLKERSIIVCQYIQTVLSSCNPEHKILLMDILYLIITSNERLSSHVRIPGLSVQKSLYFISRETVKH